MIEVLGDLMLWFGGVGVGWAARGIYFNINLRNTIITNRRSADGSTEAEEDAR